MGAKKSDGMEDLSLFLPMTKVDEEQRMVWGYASTTELDLQGERVSLEVMKRALPEYMRFANIREMHQPSAVGKAVSAEVDDKGLYIGAHVVDDVAWKKVMAKVYSGFSVGGRKSVNAAGVVTNMRLWEISLVDRPANPSAVFDLWKIDGAQKGGGGKMAFNLQKFGGPEAATEEDVEKLLGEKVASLDKALADNRTLSEKNGSLEKSLGEVKATAAEALALQAKVEELAKNIHDREEKDKEVSMKKLLDEAEGAGKFKHADRGDWESVFKKSGEAVCSRMLKTAPVVVPLGQRVGSGSDLEEDGKSAQESYMDAAEKIAQSDPEWKDADGKKREQIMTKAFVAVDRRNPELKARRDAEARNWGPGNLSVVPGMAEA